jgi:AraC-like DNA-binding protein
MPCDTDGPPRRIARDVVLEILCRANRKVAAGLPTRGPRPLVATFFDAGADLDDLLGLYVADLQRLIESSDLQIADCRIRIALDFIDKNCGQANLSLADVATAVQISKWYLGRILLKHTGRCFMAHLNDARLSAACSLLLSPQLSVKEIAARVGYSSATALDRHFKSRFASTPSKWRETATPPSQDG